MRAALLVCVHGACFGCTETEPSAEARGSVIPAEPTARQPEARPAAATEESLCPALVESRRSGVSGRGRSLSPGLRSDPDGLAAAIPEAVGAWSRTRTLTHREGHAGQMSAGASATFTRDSVRARVSVSDLVHVCLCEPGDGERMRDLRVAAHSGRALELGGWPGLAALERGEETVSVWVREWCRATVRAPSEEAALELARGLDLARIEASCDELRVGGML